MSRARRMRSRTNGATGADSGSTSACGTTRAAMPRARTASTTSRRDDRTSAGRRAEGPSNATPSASSHHASDRTPRRSGARSHSSRMSTGSAGRVSPRSTTAMRRPISWIRLMSAAGGATPSPRPRREAVSGTAGTRDETLDHARPVPGLDAPPSLRPHRGGPHGVGGEAVGRRRRAARALPSVTYPGHPVLDELENPAGVGRRDHRLSGQERLERRRSRSPRRAVRRRRPSAPAYSSTTASSSTKPGSSTCPGVPVCAEVCRSSASVPRPATTARTPARRSEGGLDEPSRAACCARAASGRRRSRRSGPGAGGRRAAAGGRAAHAASPLNRDNRSATVRDVVKTVRGLAQCPGVPLGKPALHLERGVVHPDVGQRLVGELVGAAVLVEQPHDLARVADEVATGSWSRRRGRRPRGPSATPSGASKSRSFSQATGSRTSSAS